jgi:lysozyme
MPMPTDPPALIAALDRARLPMAADRTRVQQPPAPRQPPRIGPQRGYAPSVTELAADDIAAEEGFRALPYRDVGGVPTIGYGHTGPDITMRSGPWTEPQAFDSLVARTQRDSAWLADRGYPVTEELLSAGYNLGMGGLRKTGALREAAAGNWEAAADSLRSADRVQGRVVPGLSSRRGREADRLRQRGS